MLLLLLTVLQVCPRILLGHTNLLGQSKLSQLPFSGGNQSGQGQGQGQGPIVRFPPPPPDPYVVPTFGNVHPILVSRNLVRGRIEKSRGQLTARFATGCQQWGRTARCLSIHHHHHLSNPNSVQSWESSGFSHDATHPTHPPCGTKRLPKPP